MDKEQFRNLLKRTGFKAGGVVMVHTSMDAIGHRVPGMTASSVVALFEDLMSPGGTILMPAFQPDPIHEVFRTLPRTLTSIHPTHPVTVWGKHAAALISTHHLGGTFDTFSPFYKLRDVRGVVIGIGTGLERLSLLHVAEELDSDARLRVFEKDVRTIRMLENELAFEYAYRALRNDVGRSYRYLEHELLQAGILRYVEDGGLKCAVIAADAFLRKAKELVPAEFYG